MRGWCRWRAGRRTVFGRELSRVLASTSLSFDVSVFEIFGTLTAGGCLEVVPNLLALAERGAGGPWRGTLDQRGAVGAGAGAGHAGGAGACARWRRCAGRR